jgi:uncharacterized repeat protein (TIGR01451 family)
MKTRSWVIAQNNIRKNLSLTTMLLVGSVFGIGDRIMAQQTTPATTIILNTASATYTEPVSGTRSNIISNQLRAEISPLIDPFGRVTSCSGGILPDYAGFSVGLYEQLNALGAIGAPISLTATVPPSQSATSSRIGLPPNYYNANPFFLTNSDQGGYNFLLDISRGQVDVGRVYILVVSPPPSSPLGGRKIRFTITAFDSVNNIVSYLAEALDGQPISAGGTLSVNGIIDVSDAAAVGLSLAVISVNVGACDAQGIQILKTGDRAAAEPGDIVLYRLTAKNLSTAAVPNPVIVDDLPLGFEYVDGSIRAELNGVAVPVTVVKNGRTLTITPTVLLPIANLNQSLNIVYATQITNDAIRGTGRNRASISGTSGNTPVKDGPVSHLLRIRRGILSDCGSLIGRVFIDKNFDGEQQPGEAGVPNAVLYMDDGNRIVTDPNGLYSLSNVISGSRTLAIDLTSVPGYTLAPNLYFIERNSQSRLVRLAPGALGRVNFAVTPAARGFNTDGGAK